jgi:hypothetical protein
MAIVWSHEYDDVWHHHLAKVGTTTQKILPETVIPERFPAGEYSVYIELRDDQPTLDRAGQQIPSVVVGESTWVTVQ